MVVMESHVSFQVSKVRLNGEMTIRLRLEEGEKGRTFVRPGLSSSILCFGRLFLEDQIGHEFGGGG